MKSLSILLAIASISSSVPLVHEGEIEGARYLILSPKKPSGKVLLLAHGNSLLPQGEGAAFISPDGFLVLQINGGNLAKKLEVKSSDEVTISRK